jgi:endonuclease III
VKNATAYAKKLRGLLRKVKAEPAPTEPPTDPIEQIVYAFMLWETTRRQADQAFGRLQRAFVDINELRVSDPIEIMQAIGDRYSKADERALKLRETLNAIYNIEHAVSLDALKDKSKRDARAYLDALEGIEPFVAASVVLHSLGGHAVPVDDQLVGKLKRDGIVDEDASLEEVQSFLENNIKAAEGLKTHDMLRTYVESGGTSSSAKTTKRSSKKTTKKTSKTKTTKKKTTKKKTTKKARG